MDEFTYHWFDGSTFNGQPTMTGTKTACGKGQVEDGNKVMGAAHTYFVTCTKCLDEIRKRSKTCPPTATRD